MWARSVRLLIETREQVSRKKLLKFESFEVSRNPLRSSAAGKLPRWKPCWVDLGNDMFKVTK